MRIGFLGAGKMAEAIIASVVQGGLCEPWDVTACDTSEERRKLMEAQFGEIGRASCRERV